ncbi:MAG: hypothetical protein FWG80_04320 [Alphaproteobacteria bacterium]|nr:hypothetical protein [Alphaproteobacteria bacterium]
MKKKPLLVAVEGGDKVGKTTQVSQFYDYLCQKAGCTELIKYPVYDSQTGKEIQKYLNGEFGSPYDIDPKRVIGFYANDRLADKPRVDACIKAGKNILFDRYVASNLYTAARMPKDHWPKWIRYIEYLEFAKNGLVRPDLVLYLYLDPLVAAKVNGNEESWQKEKRDVHEADLQLQINVTKIYRARAIMTPDRWRVIDQMGSDGTRKGIDEIQSNMRACLDDFLRKKVK